MGRVGPGRPEKVLGSPGWRITGETAAAYDDVIGAIDRARLPFLPRQHPAQRRRGEDEDAGAGDGKDTPRQARRSWRRGAL